MEIKITITDSGTTTEQTPSTSMPQGAAQPTMAAGISSGQPSPTTMHGLPAELLHAAATLGALNAGPAPEAHAGQMTGAPQPFVGGTAGPSSPQTITDHPAGAAPAAR